MLRFMLVSVVASLVAAAVQARLSKGGRGEHMACGAEARPLLSVADFDGDGVVDRHDLAGLKKAIHEGRYYAIVVLLCGFHPRRVVVGPPPEAAGSAHRFDERAAPVRAMDLVGQERASVRHTGLGGEVDPCGYSLAAFSPAAAGRQAVLLAVRWVVATGRCFGDRRDLSFDLSQPLPEERPHAGRARRLCRGKLAGGKCAARDTRPLFRSAADAA